MDRAARQFHACEPENRLVGRALEQHCEQTRAKQRQLEEKFERWHRSAPAKLSESDAVAVRALARDLPQVWSPPTTTAADQQRIARFPRDPQFVSKASPVLDLYAGEWEGEPLGPMDFVISSDEKTSIEARGRIPSSLAPAAGRTQRIEWEYERGGALQYLAACDVFRGIVMGRCEQTTGID